MLSSATADGKEASEVIRQDGDKQPVAPSFFLTLLRVFGPTLLLSHMCKLVCDVIVFLGPTVQRYVQGEHFTSRNCDFLKYK